MELHKQYFSSIQRRDPSTDHLIIDTWIENSTTGSLPSALDCPSTHISMLE